MGKIILKRMVLVFLLLAGFSQWAYAQGRMQNNIFAAGLNIGFIEELLEIRGVTPELIAEYLRFRDNVAGCLDIVIGDYRAPFDPSSINEAVRLIRTFDFNMVEMNNRHKIAYWRGMMDRIRNSLAVTYGMRNQGAEAMNAEPTCDSCLFEFGYYMGRAFMSAFYDNYNRKRAAVWGMMDAVRKGLSCAERLRCSFPSREQWGGLNLSEQSSVNDIRNAFPRVRQIIVNPQSLSGGDFSIPSTPPRPTPPQPPGIKMPDISGVYGASQYSTRITRQGDKFLAHRSGFKSVELQRGWKNGVMMLEVYIPTYTTELSSGPAKIRNHVWQGRVLLKDGRTGPFYFTPCKVVFSVFENRLDAFYNGGSLCIGYKDSSHIVH